MLSCAGLMLGASASAAQAIGARAAAARAGRPLLAVSCSSANACTAVGGVFAERWNGRRWSIQSVPTPAFSDPGFDFLAGVACPARRACVSVGLDRVPPSANASYDYSALTFRWDGLAWSDGSPTVSQTRNGFLLGASCPSVSDCIAVGQRGTAALAMRWHANRWRVELARGAPSAMSVLNGVSCTSARSCIAVGNTTPNQSAAPRALVERWNGGAWSVMPTPRSSPLENTFLNAVSCIPGSCTAVGSVGTEQLVERWNGRAWSIQPGPAGAPAAALNGVSCLSATACVAVGGVSGSHQPLVENWDGTRWSIERTPRLSGASLLWAASCPSAADCVAVGSHGGLPLIERWDGTSWSVQTPS